MDLTDFIDNIFKLYPNSWNAENIDLKKRQYLVAIKNPKIDFDKLLDRIALYHKGDFMPDSAWIKEQSGHCYKQEYKNPANEWISVKMFNPKTKQIRNTDCFHNSIPDEEILSFYAKKFGDGWQIMSKRAFKEV